jgi:hypothetical protein
MPKSEREKGKQKARNSRDCDGLEKEKRRR